MLGGFLSLSENNTLPPLPGASVSHTLTAASAVRPMALMDPRIDASLAPLSPLSRLQGGWRRLYHGLVAGSVCLLLHRLTFMLLQDEACRRFRPVRRRRLLLQLMSFAAAFVAYPLDTIKRSEPCWTMGEGFLFVSTHA